MTTDRLHLLALNTISVVFLLAAACSSGTPSATSTVLQPQEIEDYDALVSLMYDRDLHLVEMGEIQMPCLLVNPKALFANGGTVEIYEYEDTKTATDAISGINPTRFEAVLVEVEPGVGRK